MTDTLPIRFEKAVRFLVRYMPSSENGSRKPILFHGIRVGVYLYAHQYPEDVVVAGLLHDAIEWSGANEQLVREEFGDTVTRLVMANTKDDSITDKEEKINELIQRCARQGQDALIVKAADIIDSFHWYEGQNNPGELLYCLRNSSAIFRFKPGEFDDKIFDELKVWHDRFAHLMY